MENNRQLRALILAAGFGNRLKSLTKTTPKPLLPFFYQPILYHTLDKLRLLNISDIWVNSHYLWEKIQKSLNNYKHLQTSLAVEKDNLLGTGGCIKNLPPSSKNLLVINGDIIFDFPLQEISDFHIKNQGFATMVVRPYEQGTTPVWCKNGLIKGISQEPPLDFSGEKKSFACIHLLSQEFICKIPTKAPHCIISDYNAFIKKGYKINYLERDGFWYDLGSPQDYLKAHIEVAKKIASSQKSSFFQEIKNNFNFVNTTHNLQENSCYLKKNTLPHKRTLGENAIITHNCNIAENVEIKNSLLLPGSCILPGQVINNQIIHSL